MHHSIPVPTFPFPSPKTEPNPKPILQLQLLLPSFWAKLFVLFGACTFFRVFGVLAVVFRRSLCFRCLCAKVYTYIHIYKWVCLQCHAPGLTPPRIVPPLSQHQYLTCCIAVWKRRIFAFYCISFGLLSSAFKSSVKCFSMLHFLRVYLCVCVCIYVSMHWQTNTDTSTDTHIRIYALWLLYFQFASTNREQLWNAFKWRPKNILSLFAYCALIAPKIEYNFNSSVDQA